MISTVSEMCAKSEREMRTYALHHEEARSLGDEEHADAEESGGEELDWNGRVSALSRSPLIQIPHTCTMTGNCHWNLLDAQLQEKTSREGKGQLRLRRRWLSSLVADLLLS